MKRITCWNDLEGFGLVPLTGEACGLSYRILFDVTAQGLLILEKCLGVRITLAEAWNRGTAEHSHVGSVMLAPQMLIPIGVFALLETGCSECWLHRQGELLGIEATDSVKLVAAQSAFYEGAIVRRFCYGGTAGDRNVHLMSGRTV